MNAPLYTTEILRLALSISLILMVVSELVGALNGIGYELIYSQRQFDFPVMWAWITLLGSILVLGGVVTLVVFAVRSQWAELVASAEEGLDDLQLWLFSLPLP